ncbi:hypothetical protein [Flavonifractor plautii]|uniref:hypothetical protein n=1 Tax=Flavonifractor plautii TaxID=292800 RepID=UPI00232E87BC|nr:hypothetical protein [Flavonifractor plautii]MDB7918532.1 hypothetical protein [Flavonifractor plautii]MDB7942602.1 hypothetical protein [Flavonifractor plautii]
MSTFHAYVDAAHFHEALGNVLRFAAKRSRLPILEEAQVRFEDGHCVLTCTNLDQWCMSTIPAVGDSFSFVFVGTRKILSACKYFSGELELTYTIEPTETNPDPRGQISISDGKRSLKRSTERTSDFPELKEKPLDRHYPVNPKRLLERFKRVKYAVSSNDARPNQCCIEFLKDKIIAVDGYRLAMSTDPAVNVEKPFYIPPEVMAELTMFKDQDCTISVGEEWAAVESETLRVLTRIPGYDGFDVERAIPTSFSTEYPVDVDQLLDEVRYHQDTRDLLVELEFEDESGKLRTLARHRKDDKMDITLDGVRIGQGDLTTMFGERDLFLSMFNPQYFINVLGSKGRNLLERYLPEVPKAEVLAQLSDQTRALLEKQEFLSAEAYSKQLREQVTDIEKDMVYIQGQIDLHASQQKEQAQELMEAQVRHTQLQERIGELERKRTTGFDGNSMIDRLADLYARYEELQRENPVIADTANLDLQIHAAAEKLARRKADAYQSKYAAALAQAQERIHRLSMEFKRTKHIHDGLTAGGQCPMCRQTITEQTLPQVKGEFAASLRRIQAEGCQLTAQCKEVQELDAKARTVFEQFREDDIAAGEAELEELSGQRKQALEQAEERRNFHQQELERLHSEIQSTELDRECGMLSQEEIEELNRARTEFAGLNAKIEVLSKLVQASPEAAGKQEQDIKQMQASIQQKKELLSALAFYISKRVEINFSKLRMNRVSITLYDVVKSTGEVKDVFRFTYEGRDYICLSHSERIRAGLEVAELIKRLLGVEYPTFIDDVESVPVIDNVRPTGQVFIAKVIKGTALQVQVADNTGVPKAA